MCAKMFAGFSSFCPVFLLILLLPATQSRATGANCFLGLQFGSISSALGDEDPYAFPLGTGLFFECHPRAGRTRLFWGASTLYYRFDSRDAEFEDSYMLQVGLLGGFDILLRIDDAPVAGLTPFLGFKEYYREYRFRGELTKGYRGIAVAGLRLFLLAAGALIVGFDVEYNLLLEEDPLKVLACYQRLGIGF